MSAFWSTSFREIVGCVLLSDGTTATAGQLVKTCRATTRTPFDRAM